MRQTADYQQLLVVLFAKHRHVGVHQVEQLGDDGGDATEMTIAEAAAEDIREARHLDIGDRPGAARIDLLGIGQEQRIHALHRRAGHGHPVRCAGRTRSPPRGRIASG